MTDISPRSLAVPMNDDPSWLYTAHGVDTNLTGTLDISAFTEITHFPNGFIPSGTPLGKITATGLYGPYDAAVLDGTEDIVGFLYGPLSVSAATGNVSGAIYVHGTVVEDRLPIAVDAAGKAALTHINFI